MLCKSLTDYTTIVLMKSTLYLEIRHLPYTDSMTVSDVISKPYTLIKKVKVGINDALQTVLSEKLEFEFQENTIFYVVFHNPELDLTIVPEWFREVMIGQKSQTISIDRNGSVTPRPYVIKLPGEIFEQIYEEIG